jgi:hypothetical protein
VAPPQPGDNPPIQTAQVDPPDSGPPPPSPDTGPSTVPDEYPLKAVRRWCEENIGESLQSKRGQVYRSAHLAGVTEVG